ncbi:SDR family oxidoreductase [Roseibium litorale]|uniref:SDR family oxidoreductase n=1 Tax=Roseibium litorale TaxID=2803841 RepID=A0ABR9CRP5_9HYPH|nr:SDR family oxidoreductase [Roseibium litorale]MBD8893552.1 SDR family oxidoreductase [Roseibium litorale]
MIAVTGANGQLGRLVLEALTTKGASSVRALVRSPEKAQDLASSTVSVVEADYNKPETLAGALKGADRLLLISGSEIGQRIPQHTAVIEAAKTAGVKLIAYTSLLHADSSQMALAVEHKATEEALKASGLAYVLLRNGWYLENYDSSLAAGLQHGAITGAAGDGKIAAASRKDYADAAAAVLVDPDSSSRIYELAGSPAFTMSELAASLSEASGKEIPYTNMAKDDYAKMLLQAGLPEGFANIISDSAANAAKGSLYGSSEDLEKLIGRKSLSYQDYVRAFVAH